MGRGERVGEDSSGTLVRRTGDGRDGNGREWQPASTLLALIEAGLLRKGEKLYASLDGLRPTQFVAELLGGSRVLGREVRIIDDGGGGDLNGRERSLVGATSWLYRCGGLATRLAWSEWKVERDGKLVPLAEIRAGFNMLQASNLLPGTPLDEHAVRDVLWIAFQHLLSGGSKDEILDLYAKRPELVLRAASYLESNSGRPFVSSLRRRGMPRKHSDLLSPPEGPTLKAIDEDRQRWLARGEDPDVVAKRVDHLLAERGLIDYFFYVADDELFTSKDVIKLMMMKFREEHHQNPLRAISGTRFEDFMANVWRELGWEVAMPDPTNPGRDLEVRPEDQNDWILISAKSEDRKNARKSRIDIESLALHSQDPIKTADDCAAAVRDAVEHLGRYQRMIYIRSIQGECFPLDQSKPAHRYDLVEVPKDEMGTLMLEQATAKAFLREHGKRDLANPRKSSFRLPIERDGKTMFSISVRRGGPGRKGHVRIGSIDVDKFCTVISQFWTEPLVSIRSERPRD